MAKEQFQALIEQFKTRRDQVVAELGKTIVGQLPVIDQMLAAVFARSHCLLVGVPGLAKTMMVRALASVMDLSFKRIQFTPDLMPSDITGTNVIDEMPDGTREFRFVRGPLFANIILADEINRTPPKTQAALLEAMQERQVTVGQTTYDLPDPFFVIATQNPIEQEGTYPLPEAQLDRFMFNIHVDYPTLAEEQKILTQTTGGQAQPLSHILSAQGIMNMQKLIYSVPVSDFVVQYVARLVRATRPRDADAPEFVREMVDWGAGPRAGQHLIMAGKAFAAMAGRILVSVQDIRNAAVPVLRHRISTNFAAQAQGIGPVEIIRKLTETIPEPDVPKYDR
ncbi:MAG TPA: MoxR family ATPase [Phycisphaerae bacterium]|nr:MoxR family ATPase [Phycisphaerae bacterium]